MDDPSPTQEAGIRAGEFAVVDVRETHEYAAGHVPGAINQPLSTFNPGELPTGKPILMVCQSGGRSARATAAARAAGRDDVENYAPGTRGWADRGGELER